MGPVDCHAHVFALGTTLAEDRRYTPAHEAGVAQYLEQLAANGLSRGVLVQPSFLGTDNSFMLQALRAHPDQLRGIAVVDPGIADSALDDLAEGGVVGIRLNLVGRPLPELDKAPWRRLMKSVASRNWQVEIHRAAADLDKIIPPILDAGAKVVVDHFGRPDPVLGVSDPGFEYLLSLGHTGRVWVKLSGAYRNGAGGDKIAVDAVPLLRDLFGLDRLIWGSDWPHTLFEDVMAFKRTVDQLHTWLADEDDRQIVLCRTPDELFGWSEAG